MTDTKIIVMKGGGSKNWLVCIKPDATKVRPMVSMGVLYAVNSEEEAYRLQHEIIEDIIRQGQNLQECPPG